MDLDACVTDRMPKIYRSQFRYQFERLRDADNATARERAIKGLLFSEELAKGWVDLAVLKQVLYDLVGTHPAGRQKIDKVIEDSKTLIRGTSASADRWLETAVRAEAELNRRAAEERRTEGTDRAVHAVISGREEHRGQLRMAERMARQYDGKLIYVHGVGWHEWDGRRWASDETGAAHRAAKQTLKTALRQLADMEINARNDLHTDVKKCESASGIEGMLHLAEKEPAFAVSHRQMDADPYLFNTLDGTLDLRTGEMRDHDPRDLITKLAPHRLNAAEGEEFHRFLTEILPDEDERDYVQRLIGYSMLGTVQERVMPIFNGEGANGKGVTRDAVKAAFGDYCIEVDAALLMESRHDRHGTFKMRLRGARLVFCSETDRGRRFAEATMKRLTGGDPIEANYMHKNPIEFDPSHTLVMITNKLPVVSGDDPAVWDRIRVVPFDVVIPEDRRDGRLSERLKLHAGAVLVWAYEGYRKYEADGLKSPETVASRTGMYRADSDAKTRFLADSTDDSPGGRTPARDLFNAWEAWCRQHGEFAGTEPEFAKSMEKRGFEKKRSKVGMSYLGITLRMPTKLGILGI